MKANELRIGNYVDCFGIKTVDTIIRNTDGSYKLIVCQKMLSGVSICEEVHTKRIDLKPIPLTEEWLLKFGFEKHHADWGCDTFMLKNLTGNEWVVKYYPSELGTAKEIKGGIRLYYVHQLQNLYFALTGEELTLNKEL